MIISRSLFPVNAFDKWSFPRIKWSSFRSLFPPQTHYFRSGRTAFGKWSFPVIISRINDHYFQNKWSFPLIFQVNWNSDSAVPNSEFRIRQLRIRNSGPDNPKSGIRNSGIRDPGLGKVVERFQTSTFVNCCSSCKNAFLGTFLFTNLQSINLWNMDLRFTNCDSLICDLFTVRGASLLLGNAYPPTLVKTSEPIWNEPNWTELILDWGLGPFPAQHGSVRPSIVHSRSVQMF